MAKRIIILCIAISISATGCAGKFWTSDPEENAESEVMLARDCGLDHFKCCAEEPACSQNQACCRDPKDPSRNYCADECKCGGERDFCCEGGDPCQSGLTCYKGFCLKCGQKDDPCCGEAQECNTGLGCQNGFCTECGLNGHPCCASAPKCANEGRKDKERAECLGGTCSFCGWGGYSLCPTEPSCLSGTLSNNGTCFNCGSFNQPCCNASSTLGYECDPKDGLECVKGFCDKQFIQEDY